LSAAHFIGSALDRLAGSCAGTHQVDHLDEPAGDDDRAALHRECGLEEESGPVF
jgi:hypothetical protein